MDTRSTSESSPVTPTIIRASQDLSLPRWVNEPLPDLRAILSASEISRLTRRPRYESVIGMTRLHFLQPTGAATPGSAFMSVLDMLYD